MSASISLKQKSVAGDFFKRTVGLIGGAAGEYFEKAMPVTSSIASDTKAATASLASTLHNSSQSVMPKVRQIKAQANIRNIMRWYMTNENDLGGSDNFDAGLDFDIDTDDNSAEIAEFQISESTKNAKEISLSVVESSHRMVEAQISNTANILSSIDKQTAVITSGFDRVNDTLGKILEVVTKNTATIIETTVAAAHKEDHNANILNGKFNFNDYKKIVSGNIKNDPSLGMMAAFLPMLTSPGTFKSMMTPEVIASTLFSGLINKKSPNLKKNLQALDDAVNETIVDSLIRLGSNRSYGTKGSLARIFGIDPNRKSTDTNRSSLELKTVPFDSIAHESITNAIPGYLQRILVQLGGENLVYDYRSRSFKSKGNIKKEFVNAGTMTGSLGRANSKVQNAIGKDGFGNMVYDMMLSDIGSKRMNDSGRRLLDSFVDPKKFEEYIRGTVLKGMNLTENELKRIAQMGRNFSQSASRQENLGRDISNQAARNNANRNNRMRSYVDTANAYNVDLSEIRDTLQDEMQNIAASYRKKIQSQDATIKGSYNKPLEGINYTNAALYEIFRRLDKGINVYQVGSSKERDKPFGSMSRHLQKPKAYRPKVLTDPDVTVGPGFTSALSDSSISDDPNLLRNQELEDGSMEDLSRGERFKRWGKKRGGNLAHAVFSGSPEQVKEAFGLIIRDVTQVAGDQVKKGAASINQQFGNVSGYLKHKLFGTEYTFQDGVDEDGKPIIKKVAQNEKGGIFGFVGDYFKDMFKGTKEKGEKWFKTVAGYFDYGDNGKKEEGGVAKKRNKLISASVGAFAGAGLLGGPIGVILGAVAGNALSGLDIRDKIKDMLFGRDEKGKAKGLFSRLTDGIVDPIKYQVGKTAHHIGGILKKNVLGPLADIGGAIRDRITSSAETHFGKVFKTIGNIILSPFKGIGKMLINTAKLPITLAGGAVRGGASIAGGLTGGFLNSIANSIAGKSTHTEIDPETGEVITMSTKDWLKQRRKDRKADVKSDKYDSYKVWKQKENARRAERMKKFKGYTEEEVSIVTAESTEQMAEQTQEISDNISSLTEHALQEGSIYTHDKGIHDRLDEILDFFRGIKKDKLEDKNIIDGEFREITGASVAGIPGKQVPLLSGPTDPDANELANSAVIAASVFSATGDDVSSEESRLAGSIMDEAGKENSNRRKIIPKLKELMGIQKAGKKEGKEKEKSIFEKIMDWIGNSGLLSNLGLLAGAAALIGGLLSGELGNWIHNISEFLGNILGANDKSEGKDAVDHGVNAALALADSKVNSKWSLANPFATVYHTRPDGSGADIKDQDKTSAKFNYQLGVPLAQSITTPAAYNLLASSQANRANMYSSMRDEAILSGNTSAANKYGAKANKASELSTQYGEKSAELSEHAGSSLAANVAHNYARVGVMSGISNTVGGLTSLGAQRLGMDEENATKVGNIATAGTTSALLLNQAKSAVTPGKTSVVDNILGLVKKAFNALADKFATVDKLKGVAGKIGGIFDKIYNKTVGAMTEKLATKIAQTIAARTGQEVTKELVSTVTVGIGIAVGAVSGIISGVCSAEHLFQVKPGEADGLMTTISAVMKGVFGALEWTPVVGLVVAAIDIFDKFVFKTLFGKSLEQIIAEGLYNLLKGDGGATLSDKQGDMVSELNYYNETYGTNLNMDTFNDFANNGGWLDKAWRGGMKYDENGHFKVDEAGGRIDGGMKSWFVGGERSYAHDANGAVLRDEKGNAVQAVDKYGRGLKKDTKWGDHVGNWFSDVGRFFAGGDEYEVDANGEAIRDENGNLVVKSHEGNVFQKTGAALSSGWNSVKDWWGGKEITNPDGSKTKTTGFKDAAAKTLGNIGNTIAKPFKEAGASISEWWSGTEELDENDNPITDEDGKPIKKGGFKDLASKTLGKIGGKIGHFAKGIGAGIKDWALGEYERDENGNPILDDEGNPVRKGGLAGFIKSVGGKINTSIVQPVKEMAQGAKEWVLDKAEWVKDKAISAKDWIIEKASAGWKTISTPVKDFVSGAKDWVSNKADWIGEKAKNAGAWISEKASSAWTTISTPVKDMVSGAKSWVKEKAGWVKDKAKDAGAWISERAGNIFGTITDNITKMKDGVKDWVEKKADWVKDGAKSVGDWIGEKAKGVWDWFTKPFKDAEERGKQAEKDEAYIAAARSGGPYRVGGPISAIAGGNPLSKNFAITSGFGSRPDMGDYHKGVDLIPHDNSEQADVMSRFNGQVLSVKNDVPNSDSGAPYYGNNSGGNAVIIQSDDGSIIKNYHLKAGSIPSNIKPGSRVGSGQKIGQMGSTGRSTGSHLHYEIEVPGKNGQMIPINPMGGPINNIVRKFRRGAPANEEFTRWIKVIKEVKAQFAAKKMGYSQSRWTNITVDGYTINMRTDCSGFVSACVSCFSKIKMMESTHTMENPNHSILKQAGFIKYGWPSNGWNGLYQGDILVRDGHTEIFSNNEGSSHKVWNCGSDSSCNSAVPTGSSKPSYTTVWRHKSSTGASVDPSVSSYADISGSSTSFTNSTDSNSNTSTGLLGALSNLGNQFLYAITGGLIGSNGTSSNSEISATNDQTASNGASGNYSGASNIGPGAENLWKYFKSLGYSDKECAGVLGCWTAESGNNPKRVEWDYSNTFKNSMTYDSVATDRNALDTFTQALFNAYAKQGLSINRSAYKASDGHLYPGLGYAQWTGPRGKALLDFARSNNLKWYDSGTQLAYLDTELKGGYSNVRSAMQATNSPEEAAGVFCSKFEGYNGSGVAKRKANARSLMNQYGSRTGGPIDEESYISNIGNTYDIQRNIPITSSQESATARTVSGKSIATATSPRVLSDTLIQNNGTTSTGGTDLSGIVSALATIIEQLRSIASNTGSSSDLLGSLNEKDFVDQGLRDTLNSIKSTKPQRRTGSYPSAKSVAAIARP